MKPKTRQRRRCSGFSLGEMLATVIIGGMVLTAILSIYNRANRAAGAVLEKIDSPVSGLEVLQLLSEDLDRILGADDVIVQIRNGFDNGFVRAELVLRRMYHDKDNKEQVLEEITWRAGYDHEGQTPGLVIYRSREGVGREDKLLEDQREDWEKNYPFVPICRGVTFFQIQAYKGDELLDQWPPSAPPAGVKVTISFAEPYETVRGHAGRRRGEDQPDLRHRCDAKDQVRHGSAGDPNAPRTPTADAEQESSDEKTPATGASDRRTNHRTSTTNVVPRGSVTNERTPIQTRPTDNGRDRPGVILLITLVILVILSTLGYTLSVRVTARRHRDQYTVDYSIARHACASGMSTRWRPWKDLEFDLISRPNEPDFSDVFALSELEYQKLLLQMELYAGRANLA